MLGFEDVIDLTPQDRKLPETCRYFLKIFISNSSHQNQGVSIPGVRASLSAYLAHLVTCCERNASQRKTFNLKGYYHLINNSFEHHVRHRLQQ